MAEPRLVINVADGAVMERVAILTAHRGCTNEEHDPSNGKLPGFCVVCGVFWPCEYAGSPTPLQEPPENRHCPDCNCSTLEHCPDCNCSHDGDRNG